MFQPSKGEQLMKLISRLLVGILAISLLITGASRAQGQTQTAADFPRTVTDGAGNKVTINAKPVHIVSATLGTDEMLFSMVDPSRLTAITADSTNPAESNIVDQASLIKNHLTTADPEVIISYHPDLVFVASY